MQNLRTTMLLQHKNLHAWIVHVSVITILSIIPSLYLFSGLSPTDEAIERAAQHYGANAAERLRQWRGILQSDKKSADMEKLENVNHFFNRLAFISDPKHWSAKDYWATPYEFLVTNGGDCEDFAIAKYFSLRELGIPASRMRITYVKSVPLDQAHMVLTYFPQPASEPLILDNLVEAILPAHRRNDLIPVYSFNGDDLWLAKELSGNSQHVGGAERIGLWKDLLSRMQRENNAAQLNSGGLTP